MSTRTPTTPTAVRDAWERVADGFDRYLTPQTMALGEQVISRLDITPGTRVLDVGAGSGALAIPAARAGADVVALDIAPTMITRLRERATAEGLQLTALVGDGTAIALDDDAVDLTVSLNGISLFDDIAAGLAEAARVTRPGGQVALVTMAPLREVEFVAFFIGALRTAGGTLPPGPLPPFRLTDPDVLRATLRDAGLRDVTVEPLSWETEVPSAERYLELALSSNPIAGRLLAGLDPGQRLEVNEVLDGMLRDRAGGDGPAVLHNTLHLGRGTV